MESKFKAYLNGVSITNEYIYIVTKNIISALEEKKKISITDKKFTEELVDNIYNIHIATFEGMDFKDLEYQTIQGITTKKTLTDFRLHMTDGINEEVVESISIFHSRLLHQEYDYLIK